MFKIKFIIAIVVAVALLIIGAVLLMAQGPPPPPSVTSSFDILWTDSDGNSVFKYFLCDTCGDTVTLTVQAEARGDVTVPKSETLTYARPQTVGIGTFDTVTLTWDNLPGGIYDIYFSACWQIQSDNLWVDTLIDMLPTWVPIAQREFCMEPDDGSLPDGNGMYFMQTVDVYEPWALPLQFHKP